MHPLDPPHLHDAARRLGSLLADGSMSYESVRHVCSLWVKGQERVDKSGLQARLVWAATDMARDNLRMRRNAETAVRWAVRPLFDRLASKAEIEEAAGKAKGDLLTWDEVFLILSEEFARFQQNQRSQK